MSGLYDARLCYVEGPDETGRGYAYFTTRALAEQWGDDWNDAPYEHNAGTPYGWHPDIDGSRARWDIITVAWTGAFATPAMLAAGNSPFTVEQINQHATPWLTSQDDDELSIRLWAGIRVAAFRRAVAAFGGTTLPPQVLPAGAA